MEATPARSGTPDMRAMHPNKEGRTLAEKRSSVAVSRSARGGPRKETDAQEDWPSLATADPAFWLKGID